VYKKTLINETEKRPRQLVFCSRPDRDLPRFSRDGDEAETFQETSRDVTRSKRSRLHLHLKCVKVEVQVDPFF